MEKKQVEKIVSLFPESIYGRYIEKLDSDHLNKLYKVVFNFCEAIENGFPSGVLMSVLDSESPMQEEVDLLKKEKIKIFAIQKIFELIETGELYDNKQYYYPFFIKKYVETSYKQLHGYSNAAELISDLVVLSRKMKLPVYQILSRKEYFWTR